MREKGGVKITLIRDLFGIDNGFIGVNGLAAFNHGNSQENVPGPHGDDLSDTVTIDKLHGKFGPPGNGSNGAASLNARLSP